MPHTIAEVIAEVVVAVNAESEKKTFYGEQESLKLCRYCTNEQIQYRKTAVIFGAIISRNFVFSDNKSD